MDIWAECRDRVSPRCISNELIRVVESQEQVATNNLVDNLREQEILEQMLDETKPALPTGTDKLHYLLATPFRYPPLKFGSRFGSRFEPSLFYGSHALKTALAEAAYHRFLFWVGMSEPPPSKKFITQHTVFGIEYATRNGLKLQNEPFCDYEEHLTHPQNYSATQQLGTAMRDFGIEAFEFISARDRDRGTNAALISPAALASTRPQYQQQWLCEIKPDLVSFYTSVDGRAHQFPLETYLLNGNFPEPSE